jgi:hypothetical protein
LKQICKSPGSGDCGMAAEPTPWGNRGVQFGTEMAAPVYNKDANWHRSNRSRKECEWKQGDPAVGKRKAKTFLR